MGWQARANADMRAFLWDAQKQGKVLKPTGEAALALENAGLAEMVGTGLHPEYLRTCLNRGVEIGEPTDWTLIDPPVPATAENSKE